MKNHCIIAITLVIGCISIAPALAVTKNILVNPANFLSLQSQKHSSVSVTDTTIKVNKGSSKNLLFRVPIAEAGELPSNALVRITVGTNPLVKDADPTIGIDDGSQINRIQIINDGRNLKRNPCVLQQATQNGRDGYLGTLVPGAYTLIFDPANNFGACSANTGFASAGKFINHVDPSKGLDLVVHRDNGGEEYVFHYFNVEIL